MIIILFNYATPLLHIQINLGRLLVCCNPSSRLKILLNDFAHSCFFVTQHDTSRNVDYDANFWFKRFPCEFLGLFTFVDHKLHSLLGGASVALII